MKAEAQSMLDEARQVGISSVLSFDSAKPHLACAAHEAQALTLLMVTVTPLAPTAVTTPGCLTIVWDFSML